MKKLAILAVLSTLACACAAPSASTEGTPRHERVEATTGSNIPRRAQTGDVTVYDRDSVERAQQSTYGMPRPTN